MKKALSSLTVVTVLTTSFLSATACKDNYLEITNDEIYNQPGSTGKIDNIAFTYMYDLSENERPEISIDRFYPWIWNLKNRKKLIGNTHAVSDNYKEYWQVVIQKTKEKGIFVNFYKKSNTPIN